MRQTEEEIKILGGLNPTPRDDRDFPLGKIVDLPHPDTLPKRFRLNPPFEVKDQKDSDFCTATMSTGISELQEDVELSPEWSFAVSKEMTRDVDAWGQNLRDALLAHVKVGAVAKTSVPFSLETKDVMFCRNIHNYPSYLKELAVRYRKQSLFKVVGPYDHFDNIRSAMYLFRDEKRAAGFGTLFPWRSNQKIMKEPPKNGGGHAMYTYGWDVIDGVQYLVVRNSYGKKAGDNGDHYFSRGVINEMVEMYSSYMLIDLDPETAKYYLENSIKLYDNWVVQFVKTFFALIKVISGFK